MAECNGHHMKISAAVCHYFLYFRKDFLLNQFFYIFINLLNSGIIDFRSQEDFNGIFCLSNKHFQPIYADHDKFL